MSIQAVVKQLFKLNDQDAEVTRELESLCKIYNLTPNELNTKWEAFALTHQCDMKPTVSYIKILKNSLQREFDRSLKSRRTVKGRVTTKRAGAVGGGIDLSEYGIDMSTDENIGDNSVDNFMSNVFSGGKPNTQQQQPRQRVAPLSASLQSNTTGDTQMSQTSSQFINRKATHVLDGQYNGNLPLSLNQDEDMQDIDQELTFTQSQIKPYRYMHEKIREKGEGLDDRIDYIGGLIGQAYHIAAFGNPSYPSQESVYAYGMICSDSSAEGSKLNDKSVVLETSRDLGMGKHVPLDLSKVDSYSLFPGQIVGMKGTNHNGRAFQVEEILLPPMPEKHTLPPKENKTINMIVATGPYTLDDDLSFRPFKELLDMCQEQKPDVILLLGPFLSIHHPKVASANMDSLPEHILREQVVANIETLLDTSCTQTHVFLAPHVNDLTHHYSNLFPQPKFGTAMSSKHNRIHLSSNPASIEMNGHTIKMANMDILFRLGKEEISKSPKQADKFTRLVEHVLQQHTYYPLFPQALGDGVDAERMIDLQIHDTPDILIIPSQFKHFVKPIDHGNTIVINPGHLCRHQAGGTYARVIMYPRESIQERIRVDLFKL